MEEFFELGTLGRPHGLHGALHFFMDCDEPGNYADVPFVFLELNGQKIPYKVLKLELRDHHAAVIQLEGISSLDAASGLNGTYVFLPLAQLPPLQDHQFYYHDVIGYRALNELGEDIGAVREILENTAQDLFSIKHPRGDYFIPVDDAFILEVNKKERYFRFKLPEDYLNLFLSETNS